ncbi:hypothetical protein [Anaerocolumna jejuensis]|uniref:hypothetical protein n=1 Tax=Anaerocolumna jejuensis TaxID=259063 RepID=UPI003F7BB92A
MKSVICECMLFKPPFLVTGIGDTAAPISLFQGYQLLSHNNAVSVPIYQTAAFGLGDSYRADRLFSFSEDGPIYTRLSNPTETTHVELTLDQRELVGLGTDTIRLSLGLESPKDFIADLEQAFKEVFG